MSDPKGPRAILIGPMGSGKSTVAEALGARWALPVRDTDTDIERTEGRTISEIFVDDGEQYFRQLERRAVAIALAEHDGVLALGGGAVLDADTRSGLAGLPVVFLTVGLSEAVKRIGLGSARPMLLGNVRGQIKALLEERAPVYSSVATITVDTDGRTPASIAVEIDKRLAAERVS